MSKFIFYLSSYEDYKFYDSCTCENASKYFSDWLCIYVLSQSSGVKSVEKKIKR